MTAHRLSGLERRVAAERRAKQFSQNFHRFGWSNVIKPCRKRGRQFVTGFLVFAPVIPLVFLYLEIWP